MGGGQKPLWCPNLTSGVGCFGDISFHIYYFFIFIFIYLIQPPKQNTNSLFSNHQFHSTNYDVFLIFHTPQLISYHHPNYSPFLHTHIYTYNHLFFYIYNFYYLIFSSFLLYTPLKIHSHFSFSINSLLNQSYIFIIIYHVWA